MLIPLAFHPLIVPPEPPEPGLQGGSPVSAGSGPPMPCGRPARPQATGRDHLGRPGRDHLGRPGRDHLGRPGRDHLGRPRPDHPPARNAQRARIATRFANRSYRRPPLDILSPGSAGRPRYGCGRTRRSASAGRRNTAKHRRSARRLPHGGAEFAAGVGRPGGSSLRLHRP